MKKACIIFLLSFIIILSAFGFTDRGSAEAAHSEYLRMHVRADSNEAEAQEVKYLVKDELVDYLTPLVAEYETYKEAVKGVEANLENIRRVAERVLSENGFAYGARVALKRESFPTRVYDGYTLPAGEYTALIVELGSGQGDNWWCVVYPPLCFAGQKNIQYKSKIAEIIERWRKT